MSPVSRPEIELRFFCPHCEFRNKYRIWARGEITCVNCRQIVLKEVGGVVPSPLICLVCGNDRFYLMKDFNRGLGLLIFLFGAVTSIWTYGISLAVAAFVDAVLYRDLPFVKSCYICDSEYKGVPIGSRDKAFEHTIGDLLRPVREDWQLGKKELFSRTGSLEK